MIEKSKVAERDMEIKPQSYKEAEKQVQAPQE